MLAALFALVACSVPSGSPAADPVAAATSGQAPAATQPEPAAAPAQLPAQPTLAVETLDHGRFELAAQRGKWVVVNFWATWCAPCLREIPDLNRLDAAREDVVVVGLAYEEITRDDMHAFYADKVRPEYPVAVVDVYSPPADFETPRGLPMTYLIAPDGSVAKKFLGPVTVEELEAAIRDASVPAAAG
jgi:thiol-disulfide isomerase/thioredoxin